MLNITSNLLADNQVNKVFQVLLVEDSLSDANLIGQMFSRLGQEKWQLIHVARLNDAIAACSTYRFDVILLDLSLPDSDGLETLISLRLVESTIPIVVLTGLHDDRFGLEAIANGAQDYLVKDQITIQTITRSLRYAIERGEIYKQLHESEERLRGIFNQTFQSMILLTPDGVIIDINQTVIDFTAAKKEDLINLPLWEVKCWNHSASAQNWLKTGISEAAEGQFIRYEAQLQDASNAMAWVDFSLKPLTDDKGNVMLLIAEGRDISDRKHAEAEIIRSLEKEQELNQLKSNFVAMVSHEFRNPLCIIQGFTWLLQKGDRQIVETNKIKYLEGIQTAISNMIQLLDKILLIGRTESGKLEYKPTPLNLETFFRNLITKLRFSTACQNQIDFNCHGECSQVETDATLLEHIFTNLLTNAIKYSPRGDNIQFELVCDSDITTVQIIDHGLGIPLKDQQHLFEGFHRGSNVDHIKGTGLGLTLAKHCVDLHQGTIQVESQEGVGTTFTVKLPLHKLINK